MIGSLAKRRTAGIITAIALGIAAPAAGAKPIDTGPLGADAPTFWTQTSAASTVQSYARHPGGSNDLGYVALGTGVASLMLIGVGGTRAAVRRRRRAAVRPTMAA